MLVFLFNLGGYYLFFWGLIEQSDRALTVRLDAGEYANEETLEIKLPLTVPYATDQEAFQRINGRFEHDGEFYKMVKQRLAKDTLYVVLMKDYQVKNLVKNLEHFTELSHQPASTEKSSFSVLKLVDDFEKISAELLVVCDHWCQTQNLNSEVNPIHSSYFLDIKYPPKNLI